MRVQSVPVYVEIFMGKSWKALFVPERGETWRSFVWGRVQVHGIVTESAACFCVCGKSDTIEGVASYLNFCGSFSFIEVALYFLICSPFIYILSAFFVIFRTFCYFVDLTFVFVTEYNFFQKLFFFQFCPLI